MGVASDHVVPESAALARARAQERARIEAWLHDGVLQSLELIAAGAYEEPPDPGRLARIAADAADTLRRELAGGAPPAAPSLTAEMMRAIHRDHDRRSLPVRLEVGPIDAAPDALALGEIGDAVAEALRNADRHSGASSVTVRYELRDGVLSVLVVDDGVGFAPGERRERRLGLDRSIVGRLRRAGGDARVESAPGHGTRIRLTLALPGSERAR